MPRKKANESISDGSAELSVSQGLRQRVLSVFGSLGVDPQSAQSWCDRTALTLSDLNVELYGLRRAIEMNPDNPDYCYIYSILLSRAGQDDEALKMAQRAVELDPDQGFYFENMAQRLEIVNQGDTTIDPMEKQSIMNLYRKAAMMDRGCSYSWMRMGMYWQEYGKQEQAIESYEVVLECQPDNAEVLGRLAHLYNATSRYDEALELYRRLARLKGGSLSYYNQPIGAE
jgi:tetratricopeptide (TPR) repeat protein